LLKKKERERERGKREREREEREKRQEKDPSVRLILSQLLADFRHTAKEQPINTHKDARRH
jgi:hypothetical protein